MKFHLNNVGLFVIYKMKYILSSSNEGKQEQNKFNLNLNRNILT